MGGGFGSKLGPSASGSAFAMVACRLAKKAGAPVKLMLDRKQEHLCTGNAPSALMTVKVGAKKDGTITAVHYKAWGSAGVAGGAGTAGPVGALHGKNPNLKVESYDVYTNAGPQAPLRAPGHSQGAFGIESAVDELADALGMDPLELRRKNEASPVRAAQYDLGAKEIGWARRNKKAGDMTTGGLGPQKGAKKRGIGMANGNWYVFASENSNAQVKVHRDGSVELVTGCQDIGTGYRTAMMVVAAEELGIETADVTMRLGDTQFPEGPGSGGSVTVNSMAPVVRLAANQARTKLFELAAPLLGVKPEDLDAANGKIFVAKDPASVPGLLESMLADQHQAIFVLPDDPMLSRASSIVSSFAIAHRMATLYSAREFVVAGGLLSYGTSFNEGYRVAATYVDRILRGDRPSQLPVSLPTQFELTINMKTARAIGVTVPEALKLRADRLVD
jgi:xanthine dehydrogenase YagR molybdenum-binding subunit